VTIQLSIQGTTGSTSLHIGEEITYVLSALSVEAGASVQFTSNVLIGSFYNWIGIGNVIFAGSLLSRFCPVFVLPGFTYTNDAIQIPLTALPGLSTEEADVITGDWREIAQALLLALNNYLASIRATVQPQTASVFLLEDYNARHRELGYGMKRKFTVTFTVNFTPSDLTAEN
jgi:hypothetical protein